MNRVVGILMVLGASCGPALRTETPPDGVGPVLRLEGACTPSSVSAASVTDVRQTHCLQATPPPSVVETQAELDALLTQGCADFAPVDFTTSRVLVVSARGSAEWFTFPNFVHLRSDAIEVGLVIRPQGAPPPDALLVLPRSPATVELRWCRSVCVARCDQAIP
jgi:hypothetical protein